MPTNIFDADLDVPDDVYVVAPGPNGLAHIGRIPDDAFIIVVNKAIELPLKPRLWMCSEPLTGKTEWFQNNIEANKGIACFWDKYFLQDYPDIAYYWEHEEPLLTAADTRPAYRSLRRRATIAGQAVQLGYWLGAKRIIMCGFDASGNTYYDDTPAGEGNSFKMREGDWDWVVRLMNPMIKLMKAEGVEVVSLSKTAIDVEVI